MQLNLSFDSENRVEPLTFVLSQKSGQRIGLLDNVSNIHMHDGLESPEISFTISKYDGDKETPFWGDLTSFKLIWVKELETWFEAQVSMSQGENGTLKNVTLTRLGEAELNNIHIYGLEVNTESDIKRTDYAPTLFYNLQDTAHSLVNRILSVAPHYHIGHVDDSLKNIQRIFSFSDSSVTDAFRTVAEELSIYVDYTSNTTPDGGINREVSFYDMLKICSSCHHRWKAGNTCPKCGSTQYQDGFGEDTLICVSAEDLGQDLTVTNKPDDIRNCYHLNGGDDLITAAIRQINPNGTGYIWSFTDEMKRDMSPSLLAKVERYEQRNEYYEQDFVPTLPSNTNVYNQLVTKYIGLQDTRRRTAQEIYHVANTDELQFNTTPIMGIHGYAELITKYYDSIDFELYLKDVLMPSVSTDGVTAQTVVNGFKASTMSPISVGNLDAISLTTANSSVLNVAKLIAHPAYQITVVESHLGKSNGNITWNGKLRAENWYDDQDYAESGTLTLRFDDNFEDYVQNRVEKMLYNQSHAQRGVILMYKQTLAQVQSALRLYSLTELNNVYKSFEGAIGVLSDIGVDDISSDAYSTIYEPMLAKLQAIQNEIKVRETEIETVRQMQGSLWLIVQNTVQAELNPSTFFGSDYNELMAFCREEPYSDSNFISDGLTNAELIQRAYEFIIQAKHDITAKNLFSYEINTTLRNLLLIPSFEPLWHQFKVGNWIRVKTDDGEMFKLRLSDYEIDFDALDSISVTFSDVSKTGNISSVQSLFNDHLQLIQSNSALLNKTNDKFESMLETSALDARMDSYYDTYDKDIIGDKVKTSFHVLEELIEGTISSDEVMSLIRQELTKITLSVSNGTRQSSITLGYDGVNIDSDNVEISGDVVFKSNLTDGTTQISGSNITTGQIKSVNYHFTDGSTYSDKGTLINMLTGNIITPTVFIDSVNGQVWFQDVHMESGWIGNSRILTAEDELVLDHSKSAWKLRSATLKGETLTFTGNASTRVFSFNRTAPCEVDSVKVNNKAVTNYTWSEPTDRTYRVEFDTAPARNATIEINIKERYYAYLTKNKHFIVSNDANKGHNSGEDEFDNNDVTGECTIGQKSCPWKAGYFKDKLSLDGADVITTANISRYSGSGGTTDYVPITLSVGNWDENNHQTVTVATVLADESQQLIQPVPSASCQLDYYSNDCRIIAQSRNSLTFSCETIPVSNLTVYIVITDLNQEANVRYERLVLQASDWNNGRQVKTVETVSSDETRQLLQPHPAMDSLQQYLDCGVMLVGQGSGTTEWRALRTIPTSDLTVYLAITEVKNYND